MPYGDDQYAPPDFSALRAWSTGAVYIFERGNDTQKWINNKKIVIDANTKLGSPKQSLGLSQEDRFGREVSLDGDYLAVRAVSDDSLGDGKRGSVYVLEKESSGWVVRQKASDLQTGFSDLALGNNFGYTIFLNGDELAVGVPPRDTNSDTGVAFTLGQNKDKSWAIKQKLGEELIDENSWQNYKITSSAEPVCDGSHTYGTASLLQRHPTIISTHKWICLRVKTVAGIYIYKKLELKPAWDIKVNQTSTIVSAVVAGANPKISAGDQFGTRISVDGDYLAITAAGDDTNEPNGNHGAVYIYKRFGFSWVLEYKIVGAGGMKTVTQSGHSAVTLYASISLDGDRLAVGTPYRTDNQGYTGAVWIYKRSGTEWFREHMIIDSFSGDFTTLDSYDYFGSSVSLDGDRLAIGAPGDNNSATVTDTGAVYIFKRTSTGWGATPEKVYEKDTNFTNLKASDKFGTSVSLNGDRLAVGAPYDDASNTVTDTGAVYIFKRSSTAWAATPEKVYEYDPSSFAILDGGDQFGQVVALDGERLFVGTPGDDGYLDGYSNAGAVYVFKRGSSGWAPLMERNFRRDTTPSGFRDLAAGDAFGSSLSVYGDLLIAGAPKDGSSKGEAYVFKRSGTSWSKVLAVVGDSDDLSGLESGDSFANSVAIGEHGFVVGAPLNDTGVTPNVVSDVGAAYFFDFIEGTWSLRQTFASFSIVDNSWESFKTSSSTPPDCDSEDSFTNTGSGAKRISISSSDKDYWVCFKVKDSNNVYYYYKYQIDFTPPTISVSGGSSPLANGDILTITSSATDLPAGAKWQYTEPAAASIVCSNVANGWKALADGDSGTAGIQLTVSGISSNKVKYCFRVTDRAGNIGYAGYSTGS